MSNFEKARKKQEDKQTLAEYLDLTSSNYSDFWRDILQTLFDEDKTEQLGHYFLYANEIETESLLDYIQQRADFPDGEDGALADFYKEFDNKDRKEEDKFWNESVDDLFKYFYDNIDNREYKPNDGITFIRNSLLAANAGYKFSESTTEKIVRPYRKKIHLSYDRINSSYHQVRDEVLGRTTKSYRNLQFTHTQDQTKVQDPYKDIFLKKWIRLLMPKYSHRVEIEDLDRNFWVIGNVLAALCDYLFSSDENPYINLFKKILEEEAQLWENVLYLWTELGLLTQKSAGERHIEFLPLPVSEFENYKRYDFNDDEKRGTESKLCELIKLVEDNSDIDLINAKVTECKEEIIEKIKFLTQKYYNTDLCIIPYLRLNNYEQNFYATAIYPCIMTYFAKDKKWIQTIINVNYPVEQNYTQKLLSVDIRGKYQSKDYQWYIYGIREKEQRYRYAAPLANIDILDENDGLTWRDEPETKYHRYYGLLRVIPNIKVEDYQNGINLSELSFNIYDAAYSSITYGTKDNEIQEKLLVTYFQSADEENNAPLFINSNSEDSQILYCDYIESDGMKDWLPEQQFTNTIGRTGYYQGELVSWFNKSTIFEQSAPADFQIIKIGDFYPVEYTVQEKFQRSWTDEKGNVIEYTTVPLKGLFRVSQRYSWPNPEPGKVYPHDGLDLVGIYPENVKSVVSSYKGEVNKKEVIVYSPIYGKVEYAGWDYPLNQEDSDQKYRNGFGYYVVIREIKGETNPELQDKEGNFKEGSKFSDFGNYYYFGHLKPGSDYDMKNGSYTGEKTDYCFVRKNKIVYPGDPIGVQGTSGKSTGVHLHYCIRPNNTYSSNTNKPIDVSAVSKIPNVIGMFGTNDKYIFKIVQEELADKPITNELDSYTYGFGAYNFYYDDVSDDKQVQKTYEDPSYSNVTQPVYDYRLKYVKDFTKQHSNKDPWEYAGYLKFVRYNLKNISKKEGEEEYSFSEPQFEYYTADRIALYTDMKKWGKEYIYKAMLALPPEKRKSTVFATKVGLNYWTGGQSNKNGQKVGSAQWNYGMLFHLFYYDNDEEDKSKKVTYIGQLLLFDGFWTKNNTVFSTNSGYQFRRIAINGQVVAKRIPKKNPDGSVTYTMDMKLLNGAFRWYDHNNEEAGAKVSIPVDFELGESENGAIEIKLVKKTSGNSTYTLGAGVSPQNSTDTSFIYFDPTPNSDVKFSGTEAQWVDSAMKQVSLENDYLFRSQATTTGDYLRANQKKGSIIYIAPDTAIDNGWDIDGAGRYADTIYIQQEAYRFDYFWDSWKNSDWDDHEVYWNDMIGEPFDYSPETTASS